MWRLRARITICVGGRRWARRPVGRSCGPAQPEPASFPTLPGPMSIISISGVSKTYATGFQALKQIDLDIARGEIFALLGPNGAGKTTLIGIVCGIVTASAGKVTVD